MSDIRKLIESLDLINEAQIEVSDGQRLHWLLQQDFDVWKKIGWATAVDSSTPTRRRAVIDKMMGIK